MTSGLLVHVSGSRERVQFYCPGCESTHTLNLTPGRRPCWKFDGNEASPTFEPSVLTTYNGPDAGQVDEDGDRAPPAICHLYVRAGMIQFLPDSTHALAGQTVPMVEWPSDGN